MLKEWLPASCLGILIVAFSWSIGCAPIKPSQPPPSTPVSLATFESVSGKWAGILRMTPRSRNDDWVTLVILEDGTYRFESVRTIGIMQGGGMFTVMDGRLRVDGERGWITGRLYEDGSRRLLKVEAEGKDGVRYAADLEPSK